MRNNLKIGVLIPAFNEEHTIARTIENVWKHCKKIVVVNDGSNDKTSTVVENYPVKLISHEKNKGLASSILSGFRYMFSKGYDYVIKIDADSQMDTNMISKLTTTVKENPSIDIVCATYNPDTPWAIRKDMRIYSFLLRLATGYNTTDILSEFRIYSRKAMRFLIENVSDGGYGSPLIIIDAMKEGLITKEIKGGVSYAKELIRPFPLDAQLALRRAFITKVFKFKSVKSKIVAVLSIPIFVGLLIFNVVTGPKYHSILTKRCLRR